MRSHGIEIEPDLLPGLPSVNADADQIGQIVLNLLVNAQQALTGATGAAHHEGLDRARPLRTPTAAARARVWLHVRDNGPGIRREVQDRIFEPFFTTKSEGMGTGLGLAVSRSIAREHGGELMLLPQGEGPASACNCR